MVAHTKEFKLLYCHAVRIELGELSVSRVGHRRNHRSPTLYHVFIRIMQQ